ncbi:MAG: TIR domain-containing protein [Bacteriovoracaceae bacterium]|nr:TIR domain-containing protein [Bacteriovoracaceae bacterium]
MPNRTEIYVAFNADPDTGDMECYNLMKAWNNNDNISFDFKNAHDLNNIREESHETTIKAKLRERMNATKILVLLVGTSTKFHHKYVRWEVEIALEAGIPIIVCNVSGTRKMDKDLCPAILKNKLAIHIPFQLDIFQYALDNWPALHTKYKSEGKSEPHNYTNVVYDPLDKERERKAKARKAALESLINKKNY